MPQISFNYSQVMAGPGVTFNVLSQKEIATFNPSALGLGDIAREGECVQALAAFFDLDGFTDFCGQIDSHIVIPEFLTRYLNWLFQTLAEEFRESEDAGTVRLWGCLPFYAKFLGDGILFLWATDRCPGLHDKVNIAHSLLSITDAYVDRFLADIRKAVSNPPVRLRCGIALGQIISIGGGADYVGSCINEASRLQKLGDLTFAISRRGFDLSKAPDSEGSLRSFLTLKQTAVRGIGKKQLVYIRKDEFDALRASEKLRYSDP